MTHKSVWPERDEAAEKYNDRPNPVFDAQLDLYGLGKSDSFLGFIAGWDACQKAMEPTRREEVAKGKAEQLLAMSKIIDLNLQLPNFARDSGLSDADLHGAKAFIARYLARVFESSQDKKEANDKL